MGDALLKRAAHQRPATTKRGAAERLFNIDVQRLRLQSNLGRSGR